VFLIISAEYEIEFYHIISYLKFIFYNSPRMSRFVLCG